VTGTSDGGADAEATTEDYRALGSQTVFRGKVITLRRDTLRLPDGSDGVREVVEHVGAVAVLALDEAERVVLVNQYRHPVRARLTELPAGLLDVAGEPPLAAARRELVEEAGLQADEWHVLLDLYSSPGFSDEAVRIFLARGLSGIDRPEGFVAEAEEAGMTVDRIPLDDAVGRVLAGRISNSSAVSGILAAAVARADGWQQLRPADAPWPARSARSSS
jgi:8-oxo-dGDP phosphatase